MCVPVSVCVCASMCVFTLVVEEHSVHDPVVSDHRVGLEVDLHQTVLGGEDMFKSFSALAKGDLSLRETMRLVQINYNLPLNFNA